MKDNQFVVQLTKKDIDDLCKNCGTCCNQLTIEDRIHLVAFFGRAEDFLTEQCPYASDNGCTTYDFRPEACREWTCGVVKHIRSFCES